MPHPLRGMASARERLRILVWDEKGWLYLLDDAGSLHGQVRPPGRLAGACCADDGSTYAACGARGEVWCLKPDLSTTWQTVVPRGSLAITTDSFGRHLAVSDANGGLHVFDAKGRRVWEAQSPRPFHHLAFVPTVPHLVACADYGLVACYDMTGKLIWRDGVVAHIGALAVTGHGDRILLACYSEGLTTYSLAGKRQARQAFAEPCRLAAVSFEGGVILVAGLEEWLQMFDTNGSTIGTYICARVPVALTLSALGDHATVALADGTLVGLKLER